MSWLLELKNVEGLNIKETETIKVSENIKILEEYVKTLYKEGKIEFFKNENFAWVFKNDVAIGKIEKVDMNDWNKLLKHIKFNVRSTTVIISRQKEVLDNEVLNLSDIIKVEYK